MGPNGACPLFGGSTVYFKVQHESPLAIEVEIPDLKAKAELQQIRHGVSHLDFNCASDDHYRFHIVCMVT